MTVNPSFVCALVNFAMQCGCLLFTRSTVTRPLETKCLRFDLVKEKKRKRRKSVNGSPVRVLIVSKKNKKGYRDWFTYWMSSAPDHAINSNRFTRRNCMAQFYWKQFVRGFGQLLFCKHSIVGLPENVDYLIVTILARARINRT